MAPNVAVVQALTLLHRCELGTSLGIRSIILESDSLEIVSCLLIFLKMAIRKLTWQGSNN